MTVWLITGANSGLGLALARYVLAQGHKVIVTARDLSKLPGSLKDAKQVKLDLNASDADIKKSGQEALDIYGHIDVIVNNAGYSITGPVEELDGNVIKQQFQTNVFGVISLTQALLPSFRQRRSGHIINVSSVAGFAGGPRFGAYNASKAALEAITETLNAELAIFGIRVHIIEPGYFPTNFFSTATSNEPEATRVVGAYTDPSQGYGLIEKFHDIRVQQRQIGDAEKAAARIFELGTGTGLFKDGLLEGQGGKRAWVRVPLGTDSGTGVISKAEEILENFRSMEPVYRSTDMDGEKLEEVIRR